MSDIVQSRFACLPIDGEKNFKKKPANKTAKPVSNGKDVKKTTKKTEPVKVKANSAPAVKQAKPKKKPAQPTEKDWLKWQEKDEAFLNQNFEDEFRKALEVSAKDYQKQKKKTNFISIKDEAEPEIHPPISPPSEPTPTSSQAEHHKSPQTESPKTQIQRPEPLEVNEESPGEIPLKLALLDQLESKNKEINQLNSQITTLQKDYSEIKFRYKRLCELLHIGEVREKCQMLVQIDKLTEAQTQSQAEIVSLSAQLEQEKSKVHAMKEGKFVKEKKAVKFDANSEV